MLNKLNEIICSKDGDRFVYRPFVLFMSTLIGVTILEMCNLIMYRTWCICVGMVFINQVLHTIGYIRIQFEKLKELKES